MRKLHRRTNNIKNWGIYKIVSGACTFRLDRVTNTITPMILQNVNNDPVAGKRLELGATNICMIAQVRLGPA